MEIPSTETRPEPTALRPLDIAVMAFFLSGLLLLLERVDSRVRINDQDWAWLDAFRIRECDGLLPYLAVSLVEALAIALIVGLAHWLCLRVVRRTWIHQALGWLFLVTGVVLGFWLIRFAQHLPRVWIKPPR
jgi:hypothetical protein